MIVFNELGINLNTEKLIIDVAVKDNTYYDNVYINNIYIDTQETYLDGGNSDKAIPLKVNADLQYLESIVVTPITKQRSLDVISVTVPFLITSIDKYILNLEGLMFSTLEITDANNDKFSYSYSKDSDDSIYYRITNDKGVLRPLKSTNALKDFAGDFSGAKHFRIELDEETLASDVASTMYFVYVETIDKSNNNINSYLGITLNTSTIYNNMMMYIKGISKGYGIPKEYIDYFLQFEAFRLSIRTGHNMQAINYFNKFFKKPLEAYSRINTCYG